MGGRPRDPWSTLRGAFAAPVVGLLRGDPAHRFVASEQAFLDLRGEDQRRESFDRLRSLLVHAHDTVPFHRERMRAAGFDPAVMRSPDEIAALPPMTRLHLSGGRDGRGGGAPLLSTSYAGADLLEYRSGGTTSAPVPFVQTRDMIGRKTAAALVLKRRMGWRPGDRAAYLWGAVQDAPPTPSGFAGRVKSALRAAAGPLLFLPVGDLTDERLDAHAEALRRYRPLALQGFPSSTDLLAKRLLSRGERIPVPIVLLSAEPTYPDQRARIAEALRAEVFTFYGARECGWIASECRERHRLHVNSGDVLVEADPDGRILVTDLVNRAMPLVRYEVGDVGALDPAPCPCGDPRPVIDRLDGRLVDTFTLPSGRRVPGMLPDTRGRQLRMEGVLEAQLVQETPSTLVVRFVRGPNFAPAYLDEFRTRLDELFFGELSISFQETDRILPGPGGKVRWCVSNWKAAP